MLCGCRAFEQEKYIWVGPAYPQTNVQPKSAWFETKQHPWSWRSRDEPKSKDAGNKRKRQHTLHTCKGPDTFMVKPLLHLRLMDQILVHYVWGCSLHQTQMELRSVAGPTNLFCNQSQLKHSKQVQTSQLVHWQAWDCYQNMSERSSPLHASISLGR